MRSLLRILLGSLVLSHATIVHSDAPELPYGGVSITAMNATLAHESGTSKLKFTVANDLVETFHLLEISTPVARSAVIVARVGPQATTELASISIPSGDVLDLHTSHLWVELRGLKRSLAAGETIPVELSFGRFRVSATAHIHD